MKTDLLQQQIRDAFNLYAQAGIEAFKKHTGETPALSHICLKFNSLDAYRETVNAAKEMGVVTQEEFKGKQISWCRLQTPLEKDGLKLEWLELVEPREELNPFNGVTSIGYAAASLSEPIKIPSENSSIVFRYQSKHAAELARSP